MADNIQDEIRDHVMYSDKASGPRDDEEIALPDSPPGSRSTALLARITELEAALKPFADAHRWLEECNMGAMRAQYEASIRCTGKFCEADLKRAAELV